MQEGGWTDEESEIYSSQNSGKCSGTSLLTQRKREASVQSGASLRIFRLSIEPDGFRNLTPMMKPLYITQIFISVILLLFLCSPAQSAVLTKDTVWHGTVVITEDVLVPQGVTLTLLAGTHITVQAAENTKTDPEYLSPLTEITVRGVLRIMGNKQAPVEFISSDGKAGGWAGIIIDNGRAEISDCSISDADTALYQTGGTLRLTASLLSGNRYGVVVQGATSSARLDYSRITGNDYGLFNFSGAGVTRQDTPVTGNGKRDLYERPVVAAPAGHEYPYRELPVAREYGDEVLAGETVWQGRIRVNGVIRVPEGGRLVILPGTVVEFRKKDTNGDGIGENGLFIQGRLLAKGTREAPIFFRSAEKVPQMGDWDAINIMNSDGSQNLIEFCQIEDAYRGAHFHFSNLAITNTVFRNNYRGIQFQESAVEIRDSWLYGNKNGVQGRDSTVVFNKNQVFGNHDGVNFFRVHLSAVGNRFQGNLKEGVRLRESTSTLDENLVDGNRFGVMVSDTFRGSFSRNVISANSEIGVSLKNSDNLELSGNFFTHNGINGLNIQETRATVRGNLFAGNGERGIGILSFTGLLSGNNFTTNGLYALDYEGTADLAAPDNWWGGAVPEKVIGDKRVDAKRGRVVHDPARSEPQSIRWPLSEVPAAAFWYGTVRVDSTVTVPKGSSLVIAPGTRVLFAKGSGLTVQGKLEAAGKRAQKITFSAQEPREDSLWDEIILEYADGSRIENCVFEYATWGLHSHFTNLTVTDSLFRNNSGGLRFRSGPMLVTRSVFTGNGIGIRSYRGNGVIRENLITDNDIGIFVREKGSGLNITANNLAGNRGYGVRVGDFNDEDISAKDNWWGAGEPHQYLFDGRREPGIGTILYEPYRREQIRLEGDEQ